MALYVLEQNIKSAGSGESRGSLSPDIDVTILYEDGVQQVLLNGKNIAKMHQRIVGNTASKISVIKEVREKLVALQRQLAAKKM